MDNPFTFVRLLFDAGYTGAEVRTIAIYSELSAEQVDRIRRDLRYCREVSPALEYNEAIDVVLEELGYNYTLIEDVAYSLYI